MHGLFVILMNPFLPIESDEVSKERRPFLYALLLIVVQLTCIPATVKLSVSLSEAALRHITVDSVLVIVLDAVTCRVEVKLEFRGVPLTLRREVVNGPRLMDIRGVSAATYKVC